MESLLIIQQAWEVLTEPVSMSRKKSIQRIFTEVPGTYERVNHLLTFGLDVLWRKNAVRIAVHKGGSLWLDVCTGTGETAVCLSGKASADTQVFAVDMNSSMLCEAVRKPQTRGIRFTQADVQHLPFQGHTFDLITLSFATRNLNLSRDMLVRTFAEFRRVLKPGGRFVNLETSQPANRIVRRLFHRYVGLLVPRLGFRISGSTAGYTYLARSIFRFHDAETLSALLHEAGFQSVQVKHLLFGAVAIHNAE